LATRATLSPALSQGRGRRQRGFTLIEVVVAFVLLALVLATSFQIFTSGLQRAGDLEDYSRALVIAQTQLAQSTIGETFEEGEKSGETEDRRFRWTVATSQYDDGTDAEQRQLSSYYSVRVAVRVAWTAASGTERHLDLATLTVGRSG
jgi:general secretion pathway protein I